MSVKTNYTSCRLKNYAKICNGQDYKSVYDETGQYPVMGSGGEFSRANTFLYSHPSVLLGRKGTVDKPLFVDFPFWTVDTMYYTEIYKNTYPKFFYYLCATIDFQYYQYGSAVPSMTQRDLNEVSFPFVQYSEQQRIADFLDAKCAHIDDTIAKEKELIEKLKEYRQSVITEAVTKGLNPNAPMKDSGIDWVGKIPAHWNITKLGRIYLSRLGKMLQPNKVKSDDTLETYLCAANVTQKGISTTPHKEMWFSEKEKVLYEVKSGDLLIVEGGDVGLSCIYDSNIKSYIQNSIHCISPVKTQSLLFLSFWFKFIKGSGYLDLICNKATIAHYTKEKLLNTPFVFVPLQEQQKIATYLNEKTKLMDHAIRQKENLIAQFHQYKKSLIYEAVTGKMEV